MKYQVVSADSHVNEPPGTFIDRVPARLRDKAPILGLLLMAAKGGPSRPRR